MRNKTPKIVNEFDKITGPVFPYFASDQVYFYQFSLVFFCLFVCCRGSFRHLNRSPAAVLQLYAQLSYVDI